MFGGLVMFCWLYLQDSIFSLWIISLHLRTLCKYFLTNTTLPLMSKISPNQDIQQKTIHKFTPKLLKPSTTVSTSFQIKDLQQNKLKIIGPNFRLIVKQNKPLFPDIHIFYFTFLFYLTFQNPSLFIHLMALLLILYLFIRNFLFHNTNINYQSFNSN